MTVDSKTCLTPAEYLALERAAERKSEYLDGEMVPMPGTSRDHSLIVTNLIAELSAQLKGRPCEVHGSDLRLWVPAVNLYTYPDVMVICGEPALVDDHFDMVTNPAVLIEILSPSTAAYDRGRKLKRYRTIPSLREILLVAQDQPFVEHHSHDPSRDLWQLATARGLDSVVVLTSIDCRIALADIYARITFAARP